MTSGGEEVWDFMRLDTGQGGGCGCQCGQQDVSSNASNVPKIPQNEPKLSKMQANCE